MSADRATDNRKRWYREIPPRLGALISGNPVLIFVTLVFALLGSFTPWWISTFFAAPPYDLDVIVRAAAINNVAEQSRMPVTIVAIDDRTYEALDMPAAFPRDTLARMLSIIAAASPKAIVADVDLSYGIRASLRANGDRVLSEWLRAYRGPAPLIWPKRIADDANGMRRTASSPYDAIIAASSTIAWGHAMFISSNGVYRRWSPWELYCSDGGPTWLPSVATQIEARTSVSPSPLPPAVPARCDDRTVESPDQRIPFGPRMLRGDVGARAKNVRVVSAANLLDQNMQRDDATLFANRVVLIGATHREATDVFVTPRGLIPGVELLATTILYASVAPPPSEPVRRAMAILIFLAIVFITRAFRGFVSVFLCIAAVLLSTLVFAVALGCLGFVDALEAAIVLYIWYELARAILDAGISLVKQPEPGQTRWQAISKAYRNPPDEPWKKEAGR